MITVRATARMKIKRSTLMQQIPLVRNRTPGGVSPSGTSVFDRTPPSTSNLTHLVPTVSRRGARQPRGKRTVRGCTFSFLIHNALKANIFSAAVLGRVFNSCYWGSRRSTEPPSDCPTTCPTWSQYPCYANPTGGGIPCRQFLKKRGQLKRTNKESIWSNYDREEHLEKHQRN